MATSAKHFSVDDMAEDSVVNAPLTLLGVNTEIPCQISTKYRYCIYFRSRLLKGVSISRVCLSQAFMH